LKFHAEYADACLTALENESCDAWQPGTGTMGATALEPACRSLVEGLVADGGDCAESNGDLCQSGSCYDGKCEARAQLGEHCDGTDGVFLCCTAQMRLRVGYLPADDDGRCTGRCDGR
jgi:hypothetical protein